MSRIEVGTVVRVVYKDLARLPHGEVCVVMRVERAGTHVQSIRTGATGTFGLTSSLELLSDVDA